MYFFIEAGTVSSALPAVIWTGYTLLSRLTEEIKDTGCSQSAPENCTDVTLMLAGKEYSIQYSDNDRHLDGPNADGKTIVYYSVNSADSNLYNLANPGSLIPRSSTSQNHAEEAPEFIQRRNRRY